MSPSATLLGHSPAVRLCSSGATAGWASRGACQRYAARMDAALAALRQRMLPCPLPLGPPLGRTCLAAPARQSSCPAGASPGSQAATEQRCPRARACPPACAEHEAKQVEALGGAAPDRSRLFIGLGRAELNRTEFFSERGGLAVTMQERVFRTPGCGGEAWHSWEPASGRHALLLGLPSQGPCQRGPTACGTICFRGHSRPYELSSACPAPNPTPTHPTHPPPADVLPGEFMLQNLCSLVTAHVLGAQPGARVLDMCAAPGGKTTAIAQLMRNEGEVRLKCLPARLPACACCLRLHRHCAADAQRGGGAASFQFLSSFHERKRLSQRDNACPPARQPASRPARLPALLSACS